MSRNSMLLSIFIGVMLNDQQWHLQRCQGLLAWCKLTDSYLTRREINVKKLEKFIWRVLAFTAMYHGFVVSSRFIIGMLTLASLEKARWRNEIVLAINVEGVTALARIQWWLERPTGACNQSSDIGIVNDVAHLHWRYWRYDFAW